MLDTLKRKDFSNLLKQSFYIQNDLSGPIEMKLINVTKLGKKSKGEKRRRPFSLLFRGPLEPLLPQSIYQIQHEKLGTFQLFLVPVGPDEKGLCYEAIFT